MAYVQFKKVNNEKAIVEMIDFIGTDHVENNTGCYVNDITQPEAEEGMYPVQFINPITKEIFYEYEEIELTEIEAMQLRLIQQDLVLEELMFEIIPSLMGGE